VRETFSIPRARLVVWRDEARQRGTRVEYGEAFGLPVFINRAACSAARPIRPARIRALRLLAEHVARKRPLKYIGFGGHGHQVRDCLHPRDLAPVLEKQFARRNSRDGFAWQIFSGGAASAISLRPVERVVPGKFGPHTSLPIQPARLIYRGSCSTAAKADRLWEWRPATPLRRSSMKSRRTPKNIQRG